MTTIYCEVPAKKTHRWVSIVLNIASKLLKKKFQTPDLKLDRFECWFNATIFLQTSCRVDYVDRYTQLLSSSFYVMEPQYFVRVHIAVFYKFRVVYRKMLIEIDANLCDVSNTNKTDQHPLLLLASPIIRKYANFDYKCPFQGNLTISRMKLDSRFLPHTIVPSGQYRLNIRTYIPKMNVTAVDVQIYFTVPQSRDAHEDRAMG